MNFPKLKHALLCRILVYVVVVGGFTAPVVALACIKAVPTGIKGIFGFLMAIGLIVYIFKNFVLLMGMDIELAMLHCNNTARTQFKLPKHRRIKRIERRLSSFGRGYEPVVMTPVPSAVRYNCKSSMTVYSKGTERVVLTYHTDFLDGDGFIAIFRSAIGNSKALTGKKKPLVLDKSQRKAPLNRVTVAVIFTSRVDSEFRSRMYEAVCRHSGDGEESSLLLCVIDMENRICVFDSQRLPYVGFGYPSKNRGIKLIRKRIFGGKLTLSNNPHRLKPVKGMENLNQSLWQYWRECRRKLVTEDKRIKKRFESMSHKELIYEDDYIYLKLGNRSAWIYTERDEITKTVKIDPIETWTYPKVNQISKDMKKEIKKLIQAYFCDNGYICRFLDSNDKSN